MTEVAGHRITHPVRHRAVIFDLDGTLIDSERPILDAGAAALAAMGIADGRAHLLQLVGLAGNQGPLLRATFGESFDVDAFDLHWAREVRAAFAAGIPAREGALDLLERLMAADLPLALATNSTTGHAHQRLAEAGLDHAFPAAHVWGRDRVARPKPAPDIYLAAAEGLGVPPQACIAFEDSDPGAAAALAAGMTVIQVPDQRPAASGEAHHLADSLLAGARLAGLI